MSTRWRKRPEGSTWGDFGPDDQRGRLNLLTPEKLLEGIAEVRAGRSFCLSLPLDYPGGNGLNENRYPPVLRPTLRHGEVNLNFIQATRDPQAHDVLSDDLAILHLQYSSQWDGLSHVGALFDVNDDGNPIPVYYNGFRAHEDVIGPDSVDDCGISGTMQARSTSQARALGIENMAETCVQGRAVMVDLRHHLGDARTLVGHDTLMEVMAADGVTVEPGDMLCLHTGFADRVLAMGKEPDPALLHGICAVLDGGDAKLQEWITNSGVAVIAADNYAVENVPGTLPNASCSMLPLHNLCLFRLGVHLGELWHLTPLAGWLREHGRFRFLLTAPPLRLPGAVGSPVTPVATV